VDSPDWLSPLLDAAAMRGADRWAIEERGIPSLELMETAGAAVAEAAAATAGTGPIGIVCGSGNNGGDGLVAARLLAEQGHGVEVFLLAEPERLSPDSRTNLERFSGPVHQPAPESLAAALAGLGAVIDAIFGTGFSGAAREPAAAAIAAINGSEAPAIAVDIPSGVDASSGVAEGEAVRAAATVTFHRAKLGHFIEPGRSLTGALRTVDIGIPAEAPARSSAGTIGEAVLGLLPRRGAGSNKFSSGNVLIVGGSRGLTGAVYMASEAAIRAGAGYAAAAVPASLEPILEAKLTEVMTLGLADRKGSLDPGAAARILERAERADAVVLGPGLGREPGAAELARELIAAIDSPLLVDADGLHALGTDLEAAAKHGRALLMTPHEGELGRLLGCGSEAVSAARLDSAREAARRCDGIVVLKGSDTIVTDGERIAINALQSPALATAGTGDVLSGTIAGLIARGPAPFEAAAAGVLAHARAGRRAADRVGVESVIATDVIAELPLGLAR
jgi:NAD(P)H-hydrate epimerase